MSDVYEVNGVVVDAATGEILESDGDPIERIIAAGLEAKQQIDTWERYARAMKAAADSMLTTDRPKVQTVAGVAKRITRKNRRAPVTLIPTVVRDFELNERQVASIYECARELDPKLLDVLATQQVVPGQVIDMLITESISTYVQFDPIRKMAPEPTALEVTE